MAEIIYILKNPAFPDLIKIGKTENDLKKRIKELSTHSGVPAPFECYFACEVEEGKSGEIEKRLHFGFGDHRVNPKREFFNINPERVKRIIEGWSVRDITPNTDNSEDQDDSDMIKYDRARKSVFRFSMVDISVGEELSFIKDENITCKVADDRKVEFSGEKMSLNKVTLHVLDEKFQKKLDAVRGPDYWLFEEETLNERRLRMEESDEVT
ncbi:GIY-YIG nuclease family protein [Thioalkalivibrio sp. HK1]|uniref:GIY-YIG nuclease family protein n=1 Tax=Thioalkalivibrio sp. HK1 TaxID=1469245 RepID=UPI000470F784|nr:GIY-YIG nuclease family protein [Thioalkalivibrio sp. HK1]